MYKYALFDMDGTIANTETGVLRCAAYALGKMGIHFGSIEELGYFNGPPIKVTFMDTLGLSEKDAEQGAKYFRERYATDGIHEHCIYPGVGELIKKLHTSGVKVALATSKVQYFADEILRQYGIADCFDVTVGSSPDGKRSLKTDIVAEVLRCLDMPDRDLCAAAMIGDRKFDILAAVKFGLTAIGVSYGFAEPGELEAAGAAHICANASELENVLLHHSPKAL